MIQLDPFEERIVAADMVAPGAVRVLLADLFKALQDVRRSARGWELSAKAKQRTLARLTKENAQLRADARK